MLYYHYGVNIWCTDSMETAGHDHLTVLALKPIRPKSNSCSSDWLQGAVGKINSSLCVHLHGATPATQQLKGDCSIAYTVYIQELT